ncbi:hypothetical protein DL96DRAFT_1618606 [Flagelloscypha sp. PMI_526]|nr:hypothetical protein DL96DRAFT_1618606 [Flagelloscypha sp. PMI_526]
MDSFHNAERTESGGFGNGTIGVEAEEGCLTRQPQLQPEPRTSPGVRFSVPCEVYFYFYRSRTENYQTSTQSFSRSRQTMKHMNFITAAAARFAPSSSTKPAQRPRSHRLWTGPSTILSVEDAALEGVPEDGGVMQFPSSRSQSSDSEFEEEFREEIEDVLEQRGLYPASYKSLMMLYSFTPITAFLVLTVLLSLTALLPTSPSHPYPYTHLFPYPLPEILVGLSAFVFGMALRSPIYTASSYLLPTIWSGSSSGNSILRDFPPCSRECLHGRLAVRLGTLAILLIPQTLEFAYPTFKDPVFRRIWVMSAFWSLSEAITTVLVFVRPLPSSSESQSEITPTREQIKQRANSDHSMSLSPERRTSRPSLDETARPDQPSPDMPDENEDDEVLEAVFRAQRRKEIEDFYGMPFIKIPPFIPPIQRLSSPLLNLGIFLILGWAWLLSPTSGTIRSSNPTYPSSLQHPLSSHSDSPHVHHLPFSIVLPLTVFILTSLDILGTSGFRCACLIVGPHTIVYLTFLVSLLTFFGGLGAWEVLS